jgi:hypothetical protein
VYDTSDIQKQFDATLCRVSVMALRLEIFPQRDASRPKILNAVVVGFEMTTQMQVFVFARLFQIQVIRGNFDANTYKTAFCF